MIVYDVSAVAGLVCLAYAGYQVHPALAWLVVGGCMAFYGISGAAASRKKERK